MEKRYFNYKMILIVCIATVLALTVCCNNIDSHIKNGAMNLELGDFRRARIHFESVLQQKPSDFTARLGLGKALLQEFSAHPEDTALIFDCLTQLEAARTLKPDNEVEKLLSVVWHKRAAMLLARCDTIAAMAAISRSTGYDPKAVTPVNLAGILYFNKGEREKALNLFRMVTSIDSSSVQGYFNIGMVYWADSNYTRAYEYWYKAALRAPDDKEILTWTAMAKKRAQIPLNDSSYITDQKEGTQQKMETARP